MTEPVIDVDVPVTAQPSTLTRNDIELQRAEWQQASEQAADAIRRLSQQLTTAQQQEIALNGAIQAADAFLSKIQ